MISLNISDSKDDFLSFDLRDLLKLIDNPNKYTWVLKHLEVNPIDSSELNQMSDKDYKIFGAIESTEIYPILWKDLERLSNLNVQVINGEVIGNHADEIISLKAFDGSYWTVKSNAQYLIERLENNFKDINFVE